MPRNERPLDAGDNALLRFARDLRLLRDKAGKPTYRALSERAHYSEAALSQAAGGRKLPTLAVTLAYVRACGESEDGWEERWRRLVAELREQEEPDDSVQAPYAGLAALKEGDADRFHGRERLVGELLERLARNRVVVVFGASGSGKSSLLRAGLVPRLDGPAVVFTPGAHPVEECALQLTRVIGGPAVVLEDDPRALHRLVRQAAPDGRDLVLVVDQFEELFTLCQDEDERRRFVDALLAAATTEKSGCRVVLGVRADFYAHCTAFAGLVDAMRDGHLTVGPMSVDELRRAIVQPAVRSGYVVETALVAELVAHACGRVGVLPMLSHALLETWRRRRGTTLTSTGFHSTGGVEGALAQTAETVFDGLSADQRVVARDLLLRLVAPGDGTEDTKRRAYRAELGEDQDTALVLDRLVEARLVTVDRDRVELSHEALIRSWPRLRNWIEEGREELRLHLELTAASTAWESLHRDPGALYRGVRLARARQWSDSGRAALTAAEREYLDLSIAAETAEQQLARRRTVRLRQAVGLLTALVVLAAGTTVYAVQTGREATRERNAALSRVVAAKAAGLRRSDPSLAAQLSLAAYRLAPTDEARDGLLASLPLPHQVTRHSGNVNTVAFSPTGKQVLTSSYDRSARVTDSSGRMEGTRVLTGHTATVNAAAFRPDGAVVATASWDHTAALWDISGREAVRLSVLSGHTAEVNAVTFSQDGKIAVTASSDHTAKVWDVGNPREPRLLATMTGHHHLVVAAAFRPDGRVLATAGFDRRIALWDLDHPDAPPHFLVGHSAAVTWVAFSPDGTRLASTSQDRTARMWDAASGSQLGTMAGHEGIVRSAAFSPDGSLLATAGEDRTARMWDARKFQQIAVLEGHAEGVVSVAFAPDGRALATASDDDTALLWPLPDPRPDQVDVTRAAAWVCDAITQPISESVWTSYFPGVDYQPPCS
ncbi:hypothetical protein [Lentzea kentuckyensis]|uniref:nSTAND1 domain-containing NTPase n=1 Tax=Lentzea kentuckyensis TaxID=360086 RepID=UPI000A3929FB|nr:hypothetical protein [Lentzea kentuckyensis]